MTDTSNSTETDSLAIARAEAQAALDRVNALETQVDNTNRPDPLEAVYKTYHRATDRGSTQEEAMGMAFHKLMEGGQANDPRYLDDKATKDTWIPERW
jgi:hypothetical protein